MLNNDGNIIKDDKGKCDLLANFMINAVKTLKIEINDFKDYLQFIRKNLDNLNPSLKNIMLIIYMIAYFVSKKDENDQNIDDLKYDLKIKIVDNFLTHMCLCKIKQNCIQNGQDIMDATQIRS